VRHARTAIAFAALLAVCRASALAQATVVLPDTSQTTAMTVTISEQARIAVPAGISFNVTNIGAFTSATAATVTIDQILLASATKQLRLSVRAAASSFTPPVTGAATWTAGAVSWNAGARTAAAGAAGTLSSSAFTTVATCTASAASCSSTGLVFSLAARPAIKRSGAHTLVVTWKVESIGS
jgi:hypothetical protein